MTPVGSPRVAERSNGVLAWAVTPSSRVEFGPVKAGVAASDLPSRSRSRSNCSASKLSLAEFGTKFMSTLNTPGDTNELAVKVIEAALAVPASDAINAIATETVANLRMAPFSLRNAPPLHRAGG